jgi:MFS family permease
LVLAGPHVASKLGLACYFVWRRLGRVVSYSSLLRTPGVLRVVGSQLVARFPFGMISLAFVMHIQQVHDSYAIAGFALAAETLGAAISGPFLSRKISAWGVKRVILTGALCSGSAMFAIALFDSPPLVMIGLGLIVGLSSPPIQAAVRTIYPSLVPKKQLSALFSFDATVQEIIWVIGPLLATVLAAQISTGFAVIVMATVQISGALLFLANKEVSTLVIPKSTRRMGGVLKSKIVLANVIIGLLLVGSFSGVEVGSVAILDNKALAGAVIAALSIGSILGGLVLGPRAKTKWALSKFIIIILVGYVLVFLNPTDPLWMALCFFIAGIGIAPALGVLGAIVATSLKLGDTTEAYGWIGTGQMMGFAAGAALAGIAIETVSPESALLIALVFGIATLIVSIMTVSITPALGKTMLETQPIKIVKGS